MENLKTNKNSINYQESCFIVNAMDYYIKDLRQKTNLSIESIKYYNDIIKKYCQLENQILKLTIQES